jgi:hypothetical protein
MKSKNNDNKTHSSSCWACNLAELAPPGVGLAEAIVFGLVFGKRHREYPHLCLKHTAMVVDGDAIHDLAGVS